MLYIDRFKEQQNKIRRPNSTTTDCEGELPLKIIVALLLIVVVLCFFIIMYYLRQYRKKIHNLKTGKLNILILDNSYLFLHMFTF